tara:strand:+ start:817 stop:1065 length:249 start_codon:yes stop_codon:yes gene_type:complete
MKYTQTIKTIIVHPKGEPLFDESATHVAIDDEGGGHYLIVTQFPDDPEPGQIRLDPDELDAVYAAAKQLLNQHHNNDNDTTD